jgi:hypothetical protein
MGRIAMNTKWQALAGELLEAASSQFSRHGCNDWKWPEDWTGAERFAFADAMVRDNVGKPTGRLTAEQREQVAGYTDGEYGPPDWWVMAFLGKRLAE